MRRSTKSIIASLVLILALSSVAAVCQQPLPTVSPAEEARAQALLKKLSLDEKIDLLGGVDGFYIRAEKQIGLPRLRMSDGPFGIRNFGPATTFGGIGLAATWDTPLVRRYATVIGRDARARGVHFLLGPGINIYRAPMDGRDFEFFGEDPYLVSRIAVAYIEGVQSQGVCATVKHFVANNQEYDRHNIDSVVDERTLREIYLPGFEASVKQAHVCAIMDSYNLTNGAHMTQNGELNTDLVKKEWGFQGIIMSDWDSTYDGIAAANGGLDLEMPAGDHMNRTTLLPAIKSGQVSLATINDKVLRILRMAVHFGWLDRPQTDLSIPLFDQQSRQVALDAARSGMVLLKNQGNLLPLDKNKIKSVAVIGPDAYPAVPVGGGSAAAKPYVAVSFLQGVSEYLGDSKTYYDRGLPDYPEMANATDFTTAAENGQPGLKAEYFNNPNLSGNPVSTRTDEHINLDHSIGGGVNDNGISVRWTGYFVPRTPGNHLAFVQGPGENGGYRLYVDGKLVMDSWTRANASVSQVQIPLAAGPHQVRFEYFVNWSWGSPTVRLGIVRPEALVRPSAVTIASHADAVILAVGYDPNSESEGSDRTFELPPGQDALIKAITAANKNTIVVITSGGDVDMNSWLSHVPALMQAWYPGEEGGKALAQLVFGEYSPSGKLPVSFERHWKDNAVYDSYYPVGNEKKVVYKEGVFLGYRHFDRSKVKPLFPFGYGLSYTTFAYKNLALTPSVVSGDQKVTASFDVTNTGKREGAEVAEVYVGEPNARVPRPVKELKGFAKVLLKPGETRRVSVVLNRRAFSYYDVHTHRWTADPAHFTISVGSSSEQIELTGTVQRAQ